MKKIKFLLLISVLILMTSMTVYADNEGMIDIVVDVDDELNGTVEFTLENMDNGKKYSFSLSHVNGYKGRCAVEFGKYELVEYRILDENRKILDGTVYLEPFEVGLANPNGNWHWYLYPIVLYDKNEDVTTTKADNETETTSSIYEVLENLGKDDNDNETTDTLLIPADNKYFPNMTLDEIKIWYTKEVNSFIASGGKTKNGSTYTLEKYQDKLRYWAEWSFKEKKYQMQSAYAANVDGYDTDETRHFYEVQKKMYDFIKDYQEQYNVCLNFTNWDVANNEIPSTEVTSTTETNNNSSTVGEEESTTIDETTTISSEETSNTVDEDNSNDEETSFWGKIKEMWLTILILVVAVVVGVVMKIKYSVE